MISWVMIFSSVFLVFGQSSAKADSCETGDNTAYGLINPVVKGNTAFALDLYAQLKTAKSGNLFYSPYSISTALAMTYAGAKGETGTQMSKVLHFPECQTALHPAFSLLQDQINDAAQKNIKLSIANALWGQKGHPFRKEFKDAVKNYYKAALKEVDFRTAYEAARKVINAWVEKKTHEKIKDLVPKRVLKPMTRLVLVNAIYFKGNWASPFKTGDTKDMPFMVTPNNSVEVPMMTQKSYFGYKKNDSLQVLELPYAKNRLENPLELPSSYDDNTVSMIVLLPRQRDGLAELESSLNPANLDEWLDGLRRKKVKVFLPKFKVSTGFELSNTLKKMGMPDAFNDDADFSGMDGTTDLSIMSIIHKAFVDVNEKGTEAAAATAVFVGTRGLPPPTPTFRADHPFIFLIRHNSSGSILFMGRVVNPVK
jgi:serpin B